MWLTILHKLFGPKDNLTRDEIDHYLDDQLDNKGENLVEQKLNASEFDNLAMDGYKNSNLRSRDLERLDNKFNPPSHIISTALIISLVSSSAALVLLFVYFKQPQANEIYADMTNKEVISVEEENNTDHSAVNPKVESTINSEDEFVPRTDQTTNAEPKKQEKDNIENSPFMDSERGEFVEPEQIPSLSQQTITAISENNSKALPVRHFGKEIYLSNLKFIDFRGERIAPLTPKHTIESGIKAEQENQLRKKESVSIAEISISYHDYISEIAKMINREEYGLSVERLNHILSIYPTDENALFYSALCYFNLGQYARAIERWRDCIGSFRQNFYEESLWYTLKSYDALGNREKVNELAKRIYEEDGYYAKSALEILNTQ